MGKTWPVLLSALLLTRCGEPSGRPGTTGSSQGPREGESLAMQAAPATTVPVTIVVKSESAPLYGYTYGHALGNHVVEGTGSLPESKPIA